MNKANSSLTFIFITMLIDCIGFGIIIPVMPGLIQELLGGSISNASFYGGLLMGAYAVMQFFFSPVMGNLSDKYGRRPILLLSLLGLGIDYVLQALSPTIAFLFIGRLIAGVFGASFTTASAYIADVSTPEKRAQNFGMIGVAFGVGFILGPTIGGLCSSFGPRTPFWVAAGLSLLNFLYGFLILPESLPKDKRREFDWKKANPVGAFLQIKKYSTISGLLLATGLLFVAGYSVQAVWSFYTIEKFNWSGTMVGYSLSVVGLVVAIVQGGLIRVVVPKIGEKKAVYIGMLLYFIGFVLFAFASNTIMMFVFIVPYCLGGITMPSIQGIASKQVPEDEQGALQGLISSIMSAASIIGPLSMTCIFRLFSEKNNGIAYFPGAPFLAGALLTIVSVLVARRAFAKNSLLHQ